MDFEQFITLNTTIISLILITTWLYLGYRIYQATQKRKTEKSYMIVSYTNTQSNPRSRTPSIPELTDTDISSEEDNISENTSEEDPRDLIEITTKMWTQKSTTETNMGETNNSYRRLKKKGYQHFSQIFKKVEFSKFYFGIQLWNNCKMGVHSSKSLKWISIPHFNYFQKK